jgi:hypothetical protein
MEEMNMDNILETVKQHLGVIEDYEPFNVQIIDHINSAFFVLNQLGVGPETPFVITDGSEVWADFFGDGPVIEAVKTYVAKKVQVMFDAPTQSYLLQSMNDSIHELEFRLLAEYERQHLPEPDMENIYVQSENG